MEINQLISLLRKPEHHYEGDGFPGERMILGKEIVLELSQDQDKIYNAILKTIPKDVLVEMASYIGRDPYHAPSLIDKISWITDEHPPQKTEKNEPIGRLLRYYLDKKSKKVAYSRKRLQERFIHQSYQAQSRILRAFLNGSKDDCEWAARYLRDNWRREMSDDIASAWVRTRLPLIAYVILRHFSDEFILQEQEQLSRAAGYQYVCARVGNSPSFNLDESQLDMPAYFYVMAKLGRKVDFEAMEYRFYDFLYTYPYNYAYLEFKPVSLLSIDGVGRMIWAMGVLGMQDALARLLEFLDKLATTVSKFMDADKSQEHWPLFVANLKLQIDPFSDPDILEKERNNYIIQTERHFIFHEPNF